MIANLFTSAATDYLHYGFDSCGRTGVPVDPFEALLERLEEQAVPYRVLWEITHVCNLSCVMCYNVPLAEPELSTAECLDILEQLAAAGTLRLAFSGGEILARRDFFTIAERARVLGFALDLKTNGTLLTPELADRMAALDPVLVDISLLGASESTFDEVAGTRKAMKRTVRGVQLLRERGVRVRLNTVLLKLNVSERAQMIEIAQELGASYEQWFRLSSADDGRDRASDHRLSQQQMTEVLVADKTPFVPRLPDAMSRTCRVGLSSCTISPYGEVYPCLEMRISAGNLRRQSFAEIWKGASIFGELRARHTYANLPECRVCPINNYCEARCAGLAWKEHGDIYTGHATACLHARARFEAQHPGETAPETPLQVKLATKAKTVPGSSTVRPSNRQMQPIPLLGV